MYKILVGIEASMDSPVFDGTFMEALKISEERRNRILQSMIDNVNAKSFFYKKGVTMIKEYKHSYTICTEFDEDIFIQQCKALEKNVPGIVQKGEISPLVKYSNFKKHHNELEDKLIGIKTTDEVEIKRVSYHFTGRAIGTHDWANSNNSKEIMKRLNHKHVPNKDIIKCIENGDLVHTRINSATYRIIGVCDITINPVTGGLVQCNPK